MSQIELKATVTQKELVDNLAGMQRLELERFLEALGVEIIARYKSSPEGSLNASKSELGTHLINLARRRCAE